MLVVPHKGPKIGTLYMTLDVREAIVGKSKVFEKYKKLHLVLQYDCLSIARWHTDVIFGVYEDFRPNPRDLVILLEAGRAISSGSTKRCLHSHSPTEAKLLVADNFSIKSPKDVGVAKTSNASRAL